MLMEKLSRIIEAFLFTSDKPLSLTRLGQLLPESKPHEVKQALDELATHFRDHSLRIVEVGGGFQMVTGPDYHQYIQKLFASRSRPRLSQAALETLSVVTYKQPVSRIEIEAIRGVNSDGVLGTLLERNLIEIRGRAETVGRPLLYGTTSDFLQYFGLNDPSDLPKLEEIEAMLDNKEDDGREESTDRIEESQDDKA